MNYSAAGNASIFTRRSIITLRGVTTRRSIFARRSIITRIAICVVIALSLIGTPEAKAQIRLPAYDSRINPELLDAWAQHPGYNDARWSAFWITSPDADRGYGVYLFRKTLELSAKPESFIIHVSADNRYKLYVNGTRVSDGPALGDAHNWNFDTIDIAPWLKTGSNVLAAEVWNFAERRPVAVMSLGDTGFLIQGNGEAESAANTDKSWQVCKCLAYSPVEGKPLVRGYYACGALDRLDCAQYPWGWKDTGFDDGSRHETEEAVRKTTTGPTGKALLETSTTPSWKAAADLGHPSIKGAGNYHRWYLVPRPIPPMEVLPIATTSLGQKTIPAGTTEEILIDNGTLTTGYPRLGFSGGRGSEIKISYAEALYELEKGWRKGNRNITEGKQFTGYHDIILPDGGPGRSFEPLWWRTWRYLKISVTTAGEPLSIDSLSAVSSMYPFERVSSFSAPEDPSLQQMLDIGWRTARLCAHETYMDCPYYEQLQYFGDARIQALVTMFNTRDNYLVRNLLEQGRRSLNADGLTASRYPSHLTQWIAPYALFWLGSCHDWWMYRGDEDYLRTLLPVMRSNMQWFAERLGSDGLLREVPTWDFGDWSAGMDFGTFRADGEGRSAYLDLIHIIALREAAEMEEAFGERWFADLYRARAAKAMEAARNVYWSPARLLYADNGELKDFSEHINALAILAGLVNGNEASVLLRRTLADSSLKRCTIYFRYYLQRAMAVSGNSGMLLDNLGIWQDQMALGLSTWAEMPEPSRSDCHAWGASPNIEFFRMVLGIDSAAPGFRKVRIAPAPGKLHRISGSIPHPCGEVDVALEVTPGKGLSARVELPDGIDGVFVWNGQETPLRPGRNVISFPPVSR